MRDKLYKLDTSHKLTLLVRDAPGVLVRVAQVFARRGCNINSVAVAPMDDTTWSIMTIGVYNVKNMDQIVHQLEKLIDVKSVRIVQGKDK
jgi:acetolactate synthase-1/3 small subunit